MNKIKAAMKEASGKVPDDEEKGEEKELFPSPLGAQPGKLLLRAQRTNNPEKARKLRERATKLQSQQDLYAALDARRCLAEGAENPTELPAPDSADFGRQPQKKYGGIEVTLQRLGGSVVEESSGARYCLAGQWKHTTTEDPRVQRYENVLPPQKNPVDGSMQPESEAEVKLMRSVPQPETPEEKRSARDNLGAWQRAQVKARLQTELEETNRLAVHAEAEQPHKLLRSFTVTALDKDFVHEFAEDLSELHYLKGFTSGGGYLPESDKPDYRTYDYMAMDPVECSQVTQALGAGPMVREVDDEEKADLEKNGTLYKVIVDGRCPLLYPGDIEAHEQKEFQFRAAIGHDNRPRGYAKGMARAYGESVMREALAWAKDVGAEQAIGVLEFVLNEQKPTLLLVKGDQIKVGADRVRTFGEAIVTATHLRGSSGTETVETPTGSYTRAQPQYGRIRWNPQCTQLLTPKGFELLEEHVRIEARVIAEKLQTVPGIAELVSQSVRHQLEDAKDGTYHQGRDQLTDAIIGGGVRMKSKDWKKALQGEKGTIQMLPSTLGRLDFNIAAYVRSHLFTGMGIYGYGHHHAAAENSTALLQNIWQADPPQADPSAVAFPYKVSRLLNADDDGDIVVSQAADVELEGGQEAKVVMTIRYPCVDAPCLWALPKGTRTPFDGRNEEERERFARAIKIFGPSLIEEEPGIEEDEVSLLDAENAVRLSDKGAKEHVDKERASGPVNHRTSMELVEKKRQLGRAGPLTRDLERCTELMALAMRKGSRAKENEWTSLYQEAIIIYREALELANITSVRIEDNLTAFKYETMPTLEGVGFTIEKLGHEKMSSGEVYLGTGQAVRNALPLDYHDLTNLVDSVLPRFARTGISLLGGREPSDEEDTEPWEGPYGASRHAGLIRRLCQEEIPAIGEALAAIETEKAPFQKILADRAREYFKANPDDKERLVAESRYVLQLCEHYRRFWRTVNQKETEARSRVTRPDDEFEERISNWRGKAARGIHESMQALAKDVSAEGLAYGVARDWKPERDNSPSAGMALLTGRIGEVLLPAGTDVERIRTDEQYRAVFRRGEDIPGAFQTDTTEVTELTRLDTPENQPDAEVTAGGETFRLHVKGEGDHPLPPGVATGEYQISLTKTTRRGGLLRWRR